MLKTNYKDEILQPGELDRTYDIMRGGETLYKGIHLKKAYTPRQEGDQYSAGDVNDQNKAINGLETRKADKSALGDQVTFELIGDTLYIRRK